MPSGRAVKPGDIVTSMSRPDHRDPQHRRRRPADPVRRADLRRALQAGGGGRHRDADRRLRRRARRITTRACSAPTTRWPPTLLAAGEAALDPCWRMPLDEEYDEELKSNFADMANIGGRAGGAITAAMFLQQFTAKYPLGPPGHRRHRLEERRGQGRDRPAGGPLLTHFVLGAGGAETAAREAARPSGDDRDQPSISTCPTSWATPAGCCARPWDRARKSRSRRSGAAGPARPRAVDLRCGRVHRRIADSRPARRRCRASRRSPVCAAEVAPAPLRASPGTRCWSTSARTGARGLRELRALIEDRRPADVDDRRMPAGSRWRHYAERGYAIASRPWLHERDMTGRAAGTPPMLPCHRLLDGADPRRPCGG